MNDSIKPWALVTGGAKHLGAALSIALAEQGHNVIIHYRRSEREANNVANRCRQLGRQSFTIQGDFSNIESLNDFMNRYLKHYLNTHLLINNVGDYLTGSALNTSLNDWLSLFQVNLHTPFLLSQRLMPSIIAHRGQIVNIGISGLNRHGASIQATAYQMTKEGLWTLTRSLARELAPQGVRVNMVSPGELEASVDRRKLPMDRPASFQEVCRVVKFLLEPESRYITGQNIEVAGGLGLG